MRQTMMCMMQRAACMTPGNELCGQAGAPTAFPHERRVAKSWPLRSNQGRMAAVANSLVRSR